MFSTSVTHSHNTRGKDSLQIPLVRTAMAKKTVRNYMPTFIRLTPSEITIKVFTHSAHGFAQYAKKYYISLYMETCLHGNCYICNRN